MKKKNNKGYMLVETLLVTVFVAGVLIFLFMQFSKLSNAYDETYSYNTTEGLYALEDVRKFITTDTNFLTYINDNIPSKHEYIDITNCNQFQDKQYCLKLFELENIDKIFITTNNVPKEKIDNYSSSFSKFINKINVEGEEVYRIVASFNNSTYATLRFGDNYE